MVGLTGLPVAAQETFTGDICGNKVSLVLKTPGADANPELKKFFGVWGKGKWENNACTGLAVLEIKGNVATIEYFYGAGANSPSQPPGSFVKTDAVMKGKQLFFNSRAGYPVYYELTGEGKLNGWFSANRMIDHLQKLK